MKKLIVALDFHERNLFKKSLRTFREVRDKRALTQKIFWVVQDKALKLKREKLFRLMIMRFHRIKRLSYLKSIAADYFLQRQVRKSF